MWGVRASLGDGSSVVGNECLVSSPFGVWPSGWLSKHGALSLHHRSRVAAWQRERPIRPWLQQRAVKLPHPCALLVGPLRRSGRSRDRLVPIALVLRQRFRVPMPRCGAPLDRHDRTCASFCRRVCRRSVAAFAGSSWLASYQDPRKSGRVLRVNGVSVALDETAREVDERQGSLPGALREGFEQQRPITALERPYSFTRACNRQFGRIGPSLGRAPWLIANEFWVGSHNARNRSTVDIGAGPAARILSPSPKATNGAVRATRRGARVTGFDCGAGGGLSTARLPRARRHRPYPDNARRFWRPSSCATPIEGREELEHHDAHGTQLDGG